ETAPAGVASAVAAASTSPAGRSRASSSTAHSARPVRPDPGGGSSPGGHAAIRRSTALTNPFDLAGASVTVSPTAAWAGNRSSMTWYAPRRRTASVSASMSSTARSDAAAITPSRRSFVRSVPYARSATKRRSLSESLDRRSSASSARFEYAPCSVTRRTTRSATARADREGTRARRGLPEDLALRPVATPELLTAHPPLSLRLDLLQDNHTPAVGGNHGDRRPREPGAEDAAHALSR